MNTYLFIYAAEDQHHQRGFYSVVAYGANKSLAEAVAINRMHQDHLHILRTDTATEAAWLSRQSDPALVAELEHCGVAMQCIAA